MQFSICFGLFKMPIAAHRADAMLSIFCLQCVFLDDCLSGFICDKKGTLSFVPSAGLFSAASPPICMCGSSLGGKVSFFVMV